MLNTVNTTAYRKQHSPSFKNGAVLPVLTKGFQFLQANPVAEIVGIDALTMVAPRTYCDYKQNPTYGVETFFRESLPIVPNPFLPGLIAGAMIAQKGYKGLHTNSTTLKGLHQAWENAEKSVGKKFPTETLAKTHRSIRFEIAKKYADNVLSNTKGLVGKEFVELAPKERDFLSRRMAAEMLGEGKSKRIAKIAAQYTSMTGAEGNLKVTLGEGFSTNSNMLIRDTITAGKKLFTQEVPKKFKNLKAVVDDLGSFSKNRAFQGITSAVILGSSIQWIITKASKLITGKEGFTGNKDFGKEESKAENIKKDSSGLLGKKLLATAGMAAMTLATIGAFGKKGFLNNGGIKELGKKLELKDKFAHMDVVKVVYGSILSGRFLAARDEKELKVSVARDYLGFANWLVLGPFVAKGIAHALDKTQVNGEATGKGIKKVFSWLSDVTQKTTNEMVAMTKKMVADNPKLKAEANKKMAIHTGSNLGGLAWSMLALGFGVPTFVNKFIINKPEKEQLVKEEDDNIYSLGLNKKEELPDFCGHKLKEDDLYSNFTQNLNRFRQTTS